MLASDVLAIILGGGRGARLYPLTKLRAKPAVPLAGKYRLIDIPISNCINSGINRIFVLTQFLSASLHRHVYDTYKFDAFSGGFVELLPAEQTHTSNDWYQGTADAVRRQVQRITRLGPRDALVLAGDHLYRMDYAEFIGFHRTKEADITLAAIPVAAQDAPRFGILQLEPDGRVVSFHEKPQEPAEIARLSTYPDPARPLLGSMGIYVFRKDVLIDLLATNRAEDFGRHIIPAAVADHRVYAFPFQGYWEDIGTIAAFYESNLALTAADPPFDFYDPHRPIFTRSRYLPPSWIEACHMRTAVVAEGCWLYQVEIERCIVGLRSVIREGSRLRDVVMLGADYYEDEAQLAANRAAGRPHVGIGERVSIERAIIDKNARIGDGVVIRSHAGEPDRDEENYSIRDGIVVIPKNATVADGTEV